MSALVSIAPLALGLAIASTPLPTGPAFIITTGLFLIARHAPGFLSPIISLLVSLHHHLTTSSPIRRTTTTTVDAPKIKTTNVCNFGYMTRGFIAVVPPLVLPIWDVVKSGESQTLRKRGLKKGFCVSKSPSSARKVDIEGMGIVSAPVRGMQCAVM